MTKNEFLLEYAFVTPLSDELKRDRRPIVLYGTGNGADKVIKYLEGLGRRPEAVFASDGFVRDRSFAGMKVESFDGVAARYGKDMKILMCFGSDRAEVINFAKRLDSEYDLALPDVPLYGGDVFDAEYLARNADSLLTVREALSDGASKKLFDRAVKYRLTGKMEYLRGTEDTLFAYSRYFGAKKIHTAVDGGAYRGDSAKALVSAIPYLKTVYAFEPDASTCEKLRAEGVNIHDKYGVIVRALNAALGGREETREFSSSSSRGAGVAGGNRRAKKKEVAITTVDSLGVPVDLIKLDVEGMEYEALEGARETMRKYSPSLAVSLYHRTEDLWKLPLLIFDAYRGQNFKYYLSRPACLPMWDLTLYAVKEGI